MEIVNQRNAEMVLEPLVTRQQPNIPAKEEQPEPVIVGGWSWPTRNPSGEIKSEEGEKNNEVSEDGVYIDKNGGISQQEEIASKKGELQGYVRINLLDEEHDDKDIELEFDRAHTHTLHCPKCDTQVTRVVLRRKQRQVRPEPSPDGPVDLLGCLSCFSIFIPRGPAGSRDGSGGESREKEPRSVFDLFWIFGGKGTKPSGHPPQPGTGSDIESGVQNDVQESQDVKPDQKRPGSRPHTEAIISGTRDSKYTDILKSIVYGGLLELIASLSVVSSAAATDATTLNILALGLASVTGGVFVVAHNVRDLKNCRAGSDQETDRYRELLGRRENYILHLTFAILAFLVFGLIPPVVYGCSFRKSDNKDYKIITAAAATLIFIIILAIADAYVKMANKFITYVKSILYYVTMAIPVSGIAYASGDLFNMLIKKLGWFETSAVGNLLGANMNSTGFALSSY